MIKLYTILENCVFELLKHAIDLVDMVYKMFCCQGIRFLFVLSFSWVNIKNYLLFICLLFANVSWSLILFETTIAKTNESKSEKNVDHLLPSSFSDTYIFEFYFSRYSLKCLKLTYKCAIDLCYINTSRKKLVNENKIISQSLHSCAHWSINSLFISKIFILIMID